MKNGVLLEQSMPPGAMSFLDQSGPRFMPIPFCYRLALGHPGRKEPPFEAVVNRFTVG